jgi:hypothetical protein
VVTYNLGRFFHDLSRRQASAAIGCALAVLTPIACVAKVDITPPPPTTSTFDLVETIAEEGVANERLSFRLDDGREVGFETEAIRVLLRSGRAPRLLVTGRDAIGDWLVVVGKQEGLSSDCNVVNSAGREWGPESTSSGSCGRSRRRFAQTFRFRSWRHPTQTELASVSTTMPTCRPSSVLDSVNSGAAMGRGIALGRKRLFEVVDVGASRQTAWQPQLSAIRALC